MIDGRKNEIKNKKNILFVLISWSLSLPPSLPPALSQMGYNLSPQFTETIAAKYAVRSGRPGSLQLDSFIQVCTQLQSMTQAFREKDSAMTGNIRMSYEDFLSTTVNRLM